MFKVPTEICGTCNYTGSHECARMNGTATEFRKGNDSILRSERTDSFSAVCFHDDIVYISSISRKRQFGSEGGGGTKLHSF
jgi:hypothetical protein